MTTNLDDATKIAMHDALQLASDVFDYQLNVERVPHETARNRAVGAVAREYGDAAAAHVRVAFEWTE